MVDISERNFEQVIEATLLAGGPDAYSGGEGVVIESPEAYENAPGGYRKRRPEDYDKALCLDPNMVLDFIYATQPKIWERLKQHHGSEVKERFLKRFASEIEKRGTFKSTPRFLQASCREDCMRTKEMPEGSMIITPPLHYSNCFNNSEGFYG